MTLVEALIGPETTGNVDGSQAAAGQNGILSQAPEPAAAKKRR
jgi:hypothetical protein